MCTSFSAWACPSWLPPPPHNTQKKRIYSYNCFLFLRVMFFVIKHWLTSILNWTFMAMLCDDLVHLYWHFPCPLSLQLQQSLSSLQATWLMPSQTPLQSGPQVFSITHPCPCTFSLVSLQTSPQSQRKSLLTPQVSWLHVGAFVGAFVGAVVGALVGLWVTTWWYKKGYNGLV